MFAEGIENLLAGREVSLLPSFLWGDIMNNTKFSELRCKEVINICDGSRLGYVCDLVLDDSCGKIIALIVPGPAKFCGLFGKGDEFLIPWERISRIGEDIILVDFESLHAEFPKNKKHFL